MDRISDSDSEDVGSIPTGVTSDAQEYLSWAFLILDHGRSHGKYRVPHGKTFLKKYFKSNCPVIDEPFDLTATRLLDFNFRSR